MSGKTVTFDYRAKCRLSPDWAADEIARLRKRVAELEEDVRRVRRQADEALSNPIFED